MPSSERDALFEASRLASDLHKTSQNEMSFEVSRFMFYLYWRQFTGAKSYEEYLHECGIHPFDREENRQAFLVYLRNQAALTGNADIRWLLEFAASDIKTLPLPFVPLRAKILLDSLVPLGHHWHVVKLGLEILHGRRCLTPTGIPSPAAEL